LCNSHLSCQMGEILPFPILTMVRKARTSPPILYDSPQSRFSYVILFATPPPFLGSSLLDSSLESWRFKVLGLCVVWLCIKSQGFCRIERGSWFMKLKIWWLWQFPPCSLQRVTKFLIRDSICVLQLWQNLCFSLLTLKVCYSKSNFKV